MALQAYAASCDLITRVLVPDGRAEAPIQTEQGAVVKVRQDDVVMWTVERRDERETTRPETPDR